jgi:hypothetical protein
MKPGLARFEQKHRETVMNTSLKTNRGGALKINLGLAKPLKSSTNLIERRAKHKDMGVEKTRV